MKVCGVVNHLYIVGRPDQGKYRDASNIQNMIMLSCLLVRNADEDCNSNPPGGRIQMTGDKKIVYIAHRLNETS